MSPNMVVESKELVEKYIDVTSAIVTLTISISARAVTGEEPDEPVIEFVGPSSEEDDDEDACVAFLMADWEEVKRMGDAAVAAFREKFPESELPLKEGE